MLKLAINEDPRAEENIEVNGMLSSLRGSIRNSSQWGENSLAVGVRERMPAREYSLTENQVLFVFRVEQKEPRLPKKGVDECSDKASLLRKERTLNSGITIV